MVVWIVLGLLLIVLFAVGIVWLVRRASSDGGRPTDHQHPPSTGTGSGTAREDLDRRYARGEISREEYLAIRDDLESWRTVPTGAGPLGPGCGPLPPVRSSVLSALPSHEADRPAAPETGSSVTLDRVPFRVPVTASTLPMPRGAWTPLPTGHRTLAATVTAGGSTPSTPWRSPPGSWARTTTRTTCGSSRHCWTWSR